MINDPLLNWLKNPNQAAPWEGSGIRYPSIFAFKSPANNQTLPADIPGVITGIEQDLKRRKKKTSATATEPPVIIPEEKIYSLQGNTGEEVEGEDSGIETALRMINPSLEDLIAGEEKFGENIKTMLAGMQAIDSVIVAIQQDPIVSNLESAVQGCKITGDQAQAISDKYLAIMDSLQRLTEFYNGLGLDKVFVPSVIKSQSVEPSAPFDSWKPADFLNSLDNYAKTVEKVNQVNSSLIALAGEVGSLKAMLSQATSGSTALVPATGGLSSTSENLPAEPAPQNQIVKWLIIGLIAYLGYLWLTKEEVTF